MLLQNPMPKPADIQPIIEDAIAEVFDASLPRLREEMVRRTMEQLEALPVPQEVSPSELLNSAIAAIQEAASQAEILRRLMEGCVQFAGRCALFVVKGRSIAGWLAFGFQDDDSIKNFILDTATGPVAQAIQDRIPVSTTISDFDPGFASAVGTPVEGGCQVLPLVVRQKVAAVVYVDAGLAPEEKFDAHAIQLLMRFTGLWIELLALRKAVPEEAQAVSAAAPAGNSPAMAPEVAVAREAPAALSPEDAEIHKKARRFAKLLVEEIKLYNGQKVTEGRQNKDIYVRLQDEIEKSKATYARRYAESTAANADYFTEELIRVLADNDVTLMGAGFSR